MAENGTVKKVTESFLVDALTFTEAEARITAEMQEGIAGEFSVCSEKKSRITEVHNADREKFYLVKVGFITIDERSGEEKRMVTDILIGADNFDEAVTLIHEVMKGTISDYEVISIGESAILEVFNQKEG